jgi:hypothetical protein
MATPMRVAKDHRSGAREATDGEPYLRSVLRPSPAPSQITSCAENCTSTHSGSHGPKLWTPSAI